MKPYGFRQKKGLRFIVGDWLLEIGTIAERFYTVQALLDSFRTDGKITTLQGLKEKPEPFFESDVFKKCTLEATKLAQRKMQSLERRYWLAMHQDQICVFIGVLVSILFVISYILFMKGINA